MLLSSKEVARYLNINPDTFRQLRQLRPDFPGPVTRTKYSLPQIDHWLRTAVPYVDLLQEAKNIIRSTKPLEQIITKDW